jgi:hypothetical protein
MWQCPECNQQFIKTNQGHSCNEKLIADFLNRKSDHTLSLYHYFIEEFNKIGEFVLHPARSRIAFAAEVRFGWIHRLGKDFLDVVLTFNEAHQDNLCFYRIGEVPGGKYFQHYLRIYRIEDINDEVRKFMKMAMNYGYRRPIDSP